jgi:16S rRNA G966 N2-methylase RsmD
LLRTNIKDLGCEDRVTAVSGDVLTMGWMARAPHPADIIFVDPPYHLMEKEARQRVLNMISRCRPLMGEKGFVVLRSPISANDADFKIEGFVGPEEHAYSSEMHVMMYAPAAGE